MPHQWTTSGRRIGRYIVSKFCRLSDAPKCGSYGSYGSYLSGTIANIINVFRTQQRRWLCRKGISRQGRAAVMLQMDSAYTASKMCPRIWIKCRSVGETFNLVIISIMSECKASLFKLLLLLITITLLMAGVVLFQGWIAPALFGFQPHGFSSSLWD